MISLAKTYIHEKEEFYQRRKQFNQPGLSDVENAALLLYLNKTAFNGLYRVNSKGGFNVPFGSYKNPKIVPEGRIREASKILEKIEIFCTDFTYILKVSQRGDLCYFDPPYLPVSETAHFTAYSKSGFSYQDQISLRDTCIELDENGVQFVLSNSFVPSLVQDYSEIENFKLHVVKANRSINSVASKRGPIKEILVTNISSNSTIDSFIEN